MEPVGGFLGGLGGDGLNDESPARADDGSIDGYFSDKGVVEEVVRDENFKYDARDKYG